MAATEKQPVTGAGPFNGLLTWVDKRFPLMSLWTDHLAGYYAPKNLNFWWSQGAVRTWQLTEVSLAAAKKFRLFESEALGHPLSEVVPELNEIVATAREAVRLAQLDPNQIGAVYFTGGSTGLGFLVDRIGAAFPAAEVVRGDRYSSVVSGLAITAQRRYGAASRRGEQVRPSAN